MLHTFAVANATDGDTYALQYALQKFTSLSPTAIHVTVNDTHVYRKHQQQNLRLLEKMIIRVKTADVNGYPFETRVVFDIRDMKMETGLYG